MRTVAAARGVRRVGSAGQPRCFPCSPRWNTSAACSRAIPDDPLLRQVLPVAEELDNVPGYCPDPVDDTSAVRRPGLLQKYPGRVLIVTTPTCAVHCRYCFRRHFDYDCHPPNHG